MLPQARIPDTGRPSSLRKALLRPSGQWFHDSTQLNFNLTSNPEDYTSFRSNKGSFGVCPESQSQRCRRCFSPSSSCPEPDWPSLERDSCLLLQVLSLETSGRCGQSAYFILCIRFPHRKKKRECVTQANKSFSYSVKVVILYSPACLKALNHIITCQIDDLDKKPIKITLV